MSAAKIKYLRILMIKLSYTRRLKVAATNFNLYFNSIIIRQNITTKQPSRWRAINPIGIIDSQG